MFKHTVAALLVALTLTGSAAASTSDSVRLVIDEASIGTSSRSFEDACQAAEDHALATAEDRLFTWFDANALDVPELDRVDAREVDAWSETKRGRAAYRCEVEVEVELEVEPRIAIRVASSHLVPCGDGTYAYSISGCDLAAGMRKDGGGGWAQ